MPEATNRYQSIAWVLVYSSRTRTKDWNN